MMSIYRIILLLALPALAGFLLPVSAHNSETETILQKLDAALEKSEEWEGVKRHRLSELHKKESQARTIEERYWSNKNLFDEYSVYNADSAMAYANRNHAIAISLGDNSRRIEWDINRSFILAVTGLLKEAQDVIDGIDPTEIPADLMADYYNQLAYLYSHYGQYLGQDLTGTVDYYIQSRAYQDSTLRHASADDPMYLWYRGWVTLNASEEERRNMIEELKADVDSAAMDSRADAMKAYVLARLYERQNDRDNRIKYLAVSAICDAQIANKDIASLEELGKLMLAEDNIDRAYTYVNYCQQQAQSFHNRVRAFTLANLEKTIREEYGKRDVSQRMRLHVYLVILAVLSLVLIVAILIIVRKNKGLNESRTRLSRLNEELKTNVAELTVLRESQDDTNRRLKEINTELSNVNFQLKESNLIKEEYVGQMFSICSDYINKLESFRKDVSRKLKTGQIEALRKTVDSSSMVQSELKEFYHSFDTIFLNLFPDFVKEFNKLLRPDEQIVLGEGELLNTPLRIYALVRLGITDSVKIAALLHCSAQTVYNNRFRIRNKACIPKEHFAETVRTLGKFELGQ